jgi:hypothetical protein
MRRPTRTLALLALAPVWLATGREARAQSNSTNSAIAQQLFLDGEKLMSLDHVAEACSKFADSQRLDPAIGTLMHLAVCHEKMGKLATAWSEFTDVAGQAQRVRQREREDFARQHAAALDPKLQKIIIELSHPPEGTAIKLDDAALPLGVLGTEIPLDPGEHSLEVTAPGMKPWRQAKLNMGPSAVVTRVQVTLEEDVPVVAKTPATTIAPAPSSAPERGPTSSTSVGKLVVGVSVGVLGLVAGGIALDDGLTSAQRSGDEGKFPAGSTALVTDTNQASEARTYAIVFGVAGAAAVGTGIYLIVTSLGRTPSASGAASVTPLLGPGLAGGEMRFAW